ncbi:hypothetical protein [Rhizobium sp. GN54]|uniref:hypothetical protein n=1 Tax=Rhizobium sp. GN54 TaxID=2898150 RepID=UPI001E5A491A|nr:hypothetical protein [Rhizobium sp. GN54]MCD2183562.1 hypothetical protein [Rhizobium sp. GN54]
MSDRGSTNKLLVWHDPSYEPNELLSNLTHFLGPKCVAKINSLQGIESQLKGSGAATLLILFASPASAIHSKISTGSTFKDALRDWVTSTAHLLSIYRLNRSAIILADVSAVTRDWRPLMARLGLTPNSQTQTADPADEVSEPFWGVLATALVCGDPNALSVARELEASALPSAASRRSNLADVELAYATYRDLRTALASAETMAKERLDANEALQSRVRYGEEMLERLAIDNQSLNNQLVSLQASTGQLNADNAEKDNQVRKLGAELKDANKRLGQEIKKNQSLNRDLTKSKAQKATADAKLSSAKDSLKRIRASRTYRLTAPFRKIRNVFLQLGRSNA